MPAIQAAKEFTLTIKKSKFLAYALPITTETEALEFILALKNKHHKARHLVYAYRLQLGGQIKEKVHNDGEPNKSAAWPLYNLLKTQAINNGLLVVVRYYGGIKLGVGGLVRAYTEAGQAVLKNNLSHDRN